MRQIDFLYVAILLCMVNWLRFSIRGEFAPSTAFACLGLIAMGIRRAMIRLESRLNSRP